MRVFEIVMIVVLIGVNGFLAAAEIAIVSSRKARLSALAEDGNRRAARVLWLANHPSSFLATIQVGITLAAYFASAVGAVSLAAIVASLLRRLPRGFVYLHADGISLIIVTALLSFLSVIFGELVPKTIAVQNAEGVAVNVVRPLDILSKIARPLIWLLTITTNGVLRLFGASERAYSPSVTEEELRVMLATAESEGIVEAGEADLIEEAFQFGDTMAREVMVPRVDIVAVEAETALNEAIGRFNQTGFSRMPVFRESIDDVSGILYVKDVFRLIWANPDAGKLPVARAARPAYFVPETKPIDELLADFRSRRTHIAICVDEFGGTAGLVTMEDLLEELVGEITDEFDTGYQPFHEIEPGVLQVDGRVSVDDLLDELNLEEEDAGPHEADSVGGLISEHLGRIPVVGDSVRAGTLQLDVVNMVGNRVGTAQVVQTNGEEPIEREASRPASEEQ
ncbi:MAG TPA: hemolysin family protein [Thermomicrobiaceae bacterium]|nr:hemolysin family protein [Thermomicrobiaceae bacterium]